MDAALTSERVLTMEFIEGVPLTDARGLAAMGVDSGALARLVAETFNEMIFTFGFVHSDPHTGNLVGRRIL